jgi:hypothetical protein
VLPSSSEGTEGPVSNNQLRPFTQCILKLDRVIWLWDKTSTLRESLLVWKTVTGSYNDLDRRPSTAHGMGELETVHMTRHVNIGKYHTDVAAAFKYLDGFVSAGGLKDLKTGVLNHFDSTPANQRFIFNDEDD